MLVTLMPSVKILLDLTLVPAKSVLQEMEKHAPVRKRNVLHKLLLLSGITVT